jgi:hypothetical protein
LGHEASMRLTVKRFSWTPDLSCDDCLMSTEKSGARFIKLILDSVQAAWLNGRDFVLGAD